MNSISYYKNKLMDVSKQLYPESNWDMLKGFIDKNQKNPFNYTRQEWLQAQRISKITESSKPHYMKAG
ncbi:hypothetical protein C7H79_15650 [Nitrosomonas supralitoralis]|uniref:Uncharacterized protein n=1 Tax=Nitrosomonas supralitoralis TaxID=2116706 RepID=A0A2P7NRE1_9PROT|nr:hypothetical protein C7H79_15650 [Nitrosomonas supralitoralis]